MRNRRFALVFLALMAMLAISIFIPMQDPQGPVVSAAGVGDAWWDSNYQWRQGFNVTVASGTATNEEVMFTIRRSSGTSSSTNIYVDTKCEDDYDDIRFTDDAASPSTMDYWIEASNSSAAWVWVELDSVDTDGEYFYIYYGYSSASAASSSGNTLDYFEDFEDGDVVGWNYDVGFFSASNTQAKYGTYSGQLVDGNPEEDVGAWDCIVENAGSAEDDQYRLVFYYYVEDWINDEDTAMEAHWVQTRVYDDSGSTYVDKDQWVLGWDDSNTPITNYYGYQGTLQSSGKDDEYYIGTYVGVYDIDLDGADTWYREELDLQTAIDATPDTFDDIYFEFGLIGRDTGNSKDLENYVDHIFVYHYSTAKTVESWDSEQERNTAPAIDSAPQCTNLDDTDYLYAQYKTYYFTVNVSDADGFADITKVQLFCNASAVEYSWCLEFDEDTASFSEPGEYDYGQFELITGSCSNVSSGNDLDITFAGSPEWAANDETDYDLYVYVIDDSSETDTGNYDVNYNRETRLDINPDGGYPKAIDANGDGTRGDLDEELSAVSYVIYYGSTLYPGSSEIDCWVSASEYGTNVGPWSDLSHDNYGFFDVTCYADDEVGQDTYTFKYVAEGGGSGGTDLCHTTHTATHIADQIVVANYTVTDSRLNVNVQGSLQVWLIYDYDDAGVTTATVTVNGNSTSEVGDGKYIVYDTSTTVQLRTYNLVVSTNDPYRVTTVDQNGQSATIIWDQVVVTITAPTYTKLALGYNATGMSYTAVWDYDDVTFDGTVTLNDTTFDHSTAGSYGYAVGSVSGGSYGLTACTSNEITIIWQTVDLSFAYTWMEVSIDEYWARLDMTNLQWSIEGTTLPDAVVIYIYENGSLIHQESPSSGQLIDVVEDYNTQWRNVQWVIKINYVSAPYNFTMYEFYDSGVISVPCEHSLKLDIFSMDIDDYYITIFYQTNYENATCFIFKDGVYQSNVTTEGYAQIAKPTTYGTYTYTFVFNSTVGATSAEQDYTASDATLWVLKAQSVTIACTMYINLYQSDGNPLIWGTFKVYIDGERIPDPWVVCTSSTINMTITDIWNSTVYSDASFTVAKFVDIVTDVYELVIYNQQDYAVYVIIEFNSVNRTMYVPAHGGLIYKVYTGAYTIHIYRADNDEFLQTETGTVTDDWLIYTEKVEYPGDDGGGFAVFTVYDIIGSIAFWMLLAVVVTALFYKKGYPYIKKKWDEA